MSTLECTLIDTNCQSIVIIIGQSIEQDDPSLGDIEVAVWLLVLVDEDVARRIVNDDLPGVGRIIEESTESSNAEGWGMWQVSVTDWVHQHDLHLLTVGMAP